MKRKVRDPPSRVAVVAKVVVTAPAIVVVARYAVEPERQLLARLKCSVVASLPLWLVLIVYAVVRRLAGFEAGTDASEQRLTAHGLTNLGRLMQIATDLEPFGNARPTTHDRGRRSPHRRRECTR
jgi:hypothetical protein